MSFIGSIFHAAYSIIQAVLNTFWAVIHTFYSFVTTLVSWTWTIISGVLRTTFGIAESTLEGVAYTFVRAIHLIWSNKLAIGLIGLVLVIYLSQTQKRAVGTGRKTR